MNNLLNIWNIDIEKCYKTLYNGDKKENLPKVVRMSAVINGNFDNIETTIEIIGDLLTMEKKDKLLKRINELMKNRQIIQECMVIENNRLREEDILSTAKGEARREGLEEGIETNTIKLIKNMLKESTDYNYISKITGKTIEEIKKIEVSMKE